MPSTGERSLECSSRNDSEEIKLIQDFNDIMCNIMAAGGKEWIRYKPTDPNKD